MSARLQRGKKVVRILGNEILRESSILFELGKGRMTLAS
jgi:hypothetical protein